MVIANLKLSAFDRFEHNERQRYLGVAKQQGITVTEDEVSLGQCKGLRWLAKGNDRIVGHYLLRHDCGFVRVELFKANTEKAVREIEGVLATVSIQP
jgi:hypothetical protein